MNFKNYVLGTLSIDAFVMVNKRLAKKLGFVEAGLLGELISTYKYVDIRNQFFEEGAKGPWFFLTQPKIEESLGIKRREHDTAIKNLVKFGVIYKKRMGLPAKNYYQLNFEKIMEIYDENDPEPAPQSHCTKRTNKEGLNVQSGVDESYGQEWTKQPFIHINKNDLEKRDIKTNYNNEFVNKEFDIPLENSFKEQPKTDYDGTEPYGNWVENIINEFYAEFSVGRWSKKDWKTLVSRMSVELVRSETVVQKHRPYIYNWLKNIAYSHDLKKGKIDFEEKYKGLPLYNWLEN